MSGDTDFLQPSYINAVLTIHSTFLKKKVIAMLTVRSSVQIVASSAQIVASSAQIVASSAQIVASSAQIVASSAQIVVSSVQIATNHIFVAGRRRLSISVVYETRLIERIRQPREVGFFEKTRLLIPTPYRIFCFRSAFISRLPAAASSASKSVCPVAARYTSSKLGRD
jgi:hypothetical protein